LIEPKGEGQFTLYEDDGKSESYRDGDCLLTHITCQGAGEETYIRFCREGSYQSLVTAESLQVICPEKAPMEVWLGDCLMSRLMSAEREEELCEAWYYDAEAGIAHILLPKKREDWNIRIVFSSKDLISI
jgi:alpha-glucosidase